MLIGERLLAPPVPGFGGGFGGRGFSHFASSRGFDHRGQVGDPYWTPCNYYSYGDDSCGD
jgi:hypothetical protein